MRRLRRRTYRDKEGLFLVEGVNLLTEAAGSGGKLKELLYVDSRVEEVGLLRSEVGASVPAYDIGEDLLRWVSDVETSQGILGVFEKVDIGYEELAGSGISLLLCADQVRDPGNMGALIRIADAAGADGFAATAGCVDLYNPKVVRSAAGSHFHLPLVKGVDVEALSRDLRSKGVRMLGLDPRGDKNYLDVDFRKPTALVVGNEAFGMKEEHGKRLDGMVYIEMPGRAESLNVASAAAVVLFEALRQRSLEGGSG